MAPNKIEINLDDDDQYDLSSAVPQKIAMPPIHHPQIDLKNNAPRSRPKLTLAKINNEEEFQLASRSKRIMAIFIDNVIVNSIGNIIKAVFFKTFLLNLGMPPLYILPVTVSILICFNMSYWVLFGYYLGATPGKKMMGLRIVNEDYQLQLRLGQVIRREIWGRFVVGCTLGIGYLVALFRNSRMGVHDTIARTKVIEYRKN